jgi:hypothetical protein
MNNIQNDSLARTMNASKFSRVKKKIVLEKKKHTNGFYLLYDKGWKVWGSRNKIKAFKRMFLEVFPNGKKMLGEIKTNK